MFAKCLGTQPTQNSQEIIMLYDYEKTVPVFKCSTYYFG